MKKACLSTSSKVTDITHLTQSLGCVVGIITKWTRQRLEEIESTELNEGEAIYVEDLLLYNSTLEGNFDFLNSLICDLAEELEDTQNKIKEISNEAGKEGKRK